MKLMLCTLCVCLLAAVPGWADVTHATLEIGGEGSCGCDDSSPGTLCDGTTLGTGTFDFALDTDTNTLTLVVNNTSPDDGNPNPVMTELYFNMPRHVTGMQITSQFAAAGTQPAFSLSFDADLLDGNNPNSAPSGFGAFSVKLDNGDGIFGAIANPNASNWAGQNLAMGPATFVFALTGDLSGIDADFIADSFSKTPPGSKSVNAAAHFQSGGTDGNFSGTISDNTTSCDPLFYVEGTPNPGAIIDLIVSGQEGCHGCIIITDDNQPTDIGPITLDIGPNILTIFGINLPAGGLTAFPVRVPQNPGLVGKTFYSQWVSVEPASKVFEKSNVVSLTIVNP